MSRCRKLPMNLIEQNVFVRDIVSTGVVVDKNDYHIDSFVSSDEVVEGDNVVTRRTVHPYPINSESVTSYVDSTNYRLDLEHAASLPARGANLGDVDALKRVLQMTPDELSSLRERILAGVPAGNRPVETVKEDTDNG